jgi:hypothetical protein
LTVTYDRRTVTVENAVDVQGLAAALFGRECKVKGGPAVVQGFEASTIPMDDPFCGFRSLRPEVYDDPDLGPDTWKKDKVWLLPRAFGGYRIGDYPYLHMCFKFAPGAVVNLVGIAKAPGGQETQFSVGLTQDPYCDSKGDRKLVGIWTEVQELAGESEGSWVCSSFNVLNKIRQSHGKRGYRSAVDLEFKDYSASFEGIRTSWRQSWTGPEGQNYQGDFYLPVQNDDGTLEYPEGRGITPDGVKLNGTNCEPPPGWENPYDDLEIMGWYLASVSPTQSLQGCEAFEAPKNSGFGRYPPLQGKIEIDQFAYSATPLEVARSGRPSVGEEIGMSDMDYPFSRYQLPHSGLFTVRRYSFPCDPDAILADPAAFSDCAPTQPRHWKIRHS